MAGSNRVPYKTMLVFCFLFFLVVGQQLIIGQDADSSGNVVSGRGLVGELSRFNWWLKCLKTWQVVQMSRKCGNEIGNLIAWPDLKYSIVGDVEYIPGTSCIKPGVLLLSVCCESCNQ